MRLVLTVLGVLILLSGALWTLQGLGVVHWPASSFMLDQRIWAVYGLIAVAIGALLIWWPRRRR